MTQPSKVPLKQLTVRKGLHSLCLGSVLAFSPLVPQWCVLDRIRLCGLRLLFPKSQLTDRSLHCLVLLSVLAPVPVAKHSRVPVSHHSQLEAVFTSRLACRCWRSFPRCHSGVLWTEPNTHRSRHTHLEGDIVRPSSGSCVNASSSFVLAILLRAPYLMVHTPIHSVSAVGSSLANRETWNRWCTRPCVPVSASNWRRARCAFSNSQARHFAMTARTTTVRCSRAASVDTSRASMLGEVHQRVRRIRRTTALVTLPLTLRRVRSHLAHWWVVWEEVGGENGLQIPVCGWCSLVPTSVSQTPRCTMGLPVQHEASFQIFCARFVWPQSVFKR